MSDRPDRPSELCSCRTSYPAKIIQVAPAELQPGDGIMNSDLKHVMARVRSCICQKDGTYLVQFVGRSNSEAQVFTSEHREVVERLL